MDEDPKMQWFGAKHDAPAYEDLERVRIPIGDTCDLCGELIKKDASGFMLWRYSFNEAVRRPWHRHCLLENILGPQWKSLEN